MSEQESLAQSNAFDPESWRRLLRVRDERGVEQHHIVRRARAAARSQSRHEQLIDRLHAAERELAAVEQDLERRASVHHAARPLQLIAAAAIVGASGLAVSLHAVDADLPTMLLAAFLAGGLPVAIDALRDHALHDLVNGSEADIRAPHVAATLGAAFAGGLVCLVGVTYQAPAAWLVGWLLAGALAVFAPSLLVAERAAKAFRASAERLRLHRRHRQVEVDVDLLRKELETELREYDPARRRLQKDARASAVPEVVPASAQPRYNGVAS